MRLFVQERGYTSAPSIAAEELAWILVEDNWNDFNYRTLYDIYRQRDGVSVRFGSVKILRRGQEPGPPPLPRGESPGASLPDDYGSIGASLDFYGNIARLEPGERGWLLAALRDLTVDPARQRALANEPGLSASLFRFLIEPSQYYADAERILNAGVLPTDEAGLSFSFAPGPETQAISFTFAGPDGRVFSGDRLPSSRVIVLVGENGAGKTELLARLARVAYTPPAERADLQQDGHFEGEPVFPSLVAVSYSAFDTFAPPRLEGDDVDQVVAQLSEGSGRYAYCGVRDIARSFEYPDQPPMLLRQDQMDVMFADRIRQVRANDRFNLLVHALEPVLADPSFGRYWGEDPDPEVSAATRFERFLGEDPAAAVKALSSGHKIVLHLLASLTVCLNKGGLALIDEPETHLHPPLLASLMTGVRRLLDARQAFAIIATHSPVVVQETLASQVRILLSGEAGPRVRAPSIQTFGENAGSLTREIFGLHTSATDYRAILGRMAKDFGSDKTIEQRLGQPLSSQALAHVLASLRGDNA